MLKANKKAFAELMQKNNLTIIKFAKFMGMSRSQIWRVLKNGGSPGEEFIAKFKTSFPELKFEDYFFTCYVA